MRKLWILLFAVVPVFVLGVFFYAAKAGPASGLWLVPNRSTIGHEIDHLFWVITWITGITFFGVQGVFLYFLWKYGGKDDVDRRCIYTHGNHRLEMIWTIAPAGILVFIALYQYGAWQKAKFITQAPSERVQARVLGGQFEWRVRYPHADVNVSAAQLASRAETPDVDQRLWRGGELEMVNELHAVKGKPLVVNIRSRDVIHSFFIPEMRMKQDLMPGMDRQVMWLTPEQAGRFEVACAELCGWGHYKMRAHLIVHETQQEYDAWYQGALAAQNADQEETDR